MYYMGKSNDLKNGGHTAKFQAKCKRYKRSCHHSRRDRKRSLIAQSVEDAEDVVLIHNLLTDHGYNAILHHDGIRIPNVPNLPLFLPEEFIKHCEYGFSCEAHIEYNITSHSEYAHMPIIDVMKHKLVEPYYINHVDNNPQYQLKMSRYIIATIKQLERRGEMRAFHGWRRQPRGVFDSDASLDLWKRPANSYRYYYLHYNNYGDGWYGW